jgi:uracil-DNA glycosylase
MWEKYWRDRGHPWEHDPGPDPNGPWAKLFAQTPNYRQIGHDRLQREAFRWQFGPMFYRGRLQPGQANVLVVGQEGAQDESLAHRSFVGGTGAKIQHLLNWIGISHSYLLLNTFVYPIFGQYDTDLATLSKDPTCPIVQHRHAIFELAASTNNLRLVVAVGSAAADSIQTWVKMRGGALPSGARSIHVLHPGAAAAGDPAAVRASFVQAVQQIGGWVHDNPGWLPPDPGAVRPIVQPYRYSDSPIPFGDLPFGTNWRLGESGTSSNRRDGQRSIQLFSEGGTYDNQDVAYSGHADGTPDGYQEDAGDLPFEPPKVEFGAFDPGPSSSVATLAMGGAPGLDWPDFSALALPGHPSFGFGPILRGRVESASVLVLADPESHDDLFTGRAMSGDGGQRAQKFLAAAGLNTQYAIFRVLPVDTLGAPDSVVNAALQNPQILKLYGALLAKATNARALVCFGRFATQLARTLKPALTVIESKSTLETGWQAAWSQALQALSHVTYPREVQASFVYDGSRGQIARADLPYGTLRWEGSSGSRSLQGAVSGKPSPDYFKLVMPAWAAAAKP